MIKPDIIIAWPTNADYPLWRAFIKEFRTHFDKVIVIFTETYTDTNYRDFVIDQMEADNVTLINSDPVGSDQDWRDVAVKTGLRHSYSEWVWFTEQDFMPIPRFFDYVDNKVNDGINVIAVYQENRLHPCSIFITRAILNSLNVDYGIIPNVADHFCKLQYEIEKYQIPVAKIPDEYYYHFNGLSHNWNLVSIDQPAVYKPVVFNKYLISCLDIPEKLDPDFKLDPRFVEIAKKAISAHNAEIKEKE